MVGDMKVSLSHPLIKAQCAGVPARALDAAQVFDFESKAAAQLRASKALKIGIVGFGNFGQFLAVRMISQGHTVRHASSVSCGPYGQPRRLSATMPLSRFKCDGCCSALPVNTFATIAPQQANTP